MNKKYKVFLLVFISLILTSCIKSNYKNYKYGVVKTTEQKDQSYILFYDDKLHELGKQSIKYGSMGDGFLLPIIYDNYMYIVPKGLGKTKEHTFVMEYNLDNGEVNKYNTGLQNMNGISITEDSVYGVNTMNSYTNIVKCDKETKRIIKTELEGVYIGYLKTYGNIIYAFGEELKSGNRKICLYLFDSKNLDLLDKIDITSIGFGQESTLIKNNKLYFNTQYEVGGFEDKIANKLSEYDIDSGEIKTYELKEDFPFQIMEFGDKLLITHFDPVRVEGNKISIFDLKTGNSEMIELEHDIWQLEKDGNNFVVLGNDCLYIYDSSFKLINSTEIAVNDGHLYYYLSGFFIKQY